MMSMGISCHILAFGLLFLPLQTVAAHGSNSTQPDPDDLEGWRLGRSMVWAWIAWTAALMMWCFWHQAATYVRTISAAGKDNQIFFSTPNDVYGFAKKHLLDAPLFKTRHHREYRLSRAVNMGTLPSRVQALSLCAYFVMTITLTCYNIDWHKSQSTIVEQILKRTGYLAIFNMLPLFLLAGRNNPLIYWTGITFDTYNLIHRWLGRIVVFEAFVHALAWLIPKVHKGGWTAVSMSLQKSSFILSGTIGALAFLSIFVLSPSAVRHAFYEIFLHLHILLAALSLGAIWIHLEKYPSHQRIIVGVLSIWLIERSIRLIRILWWNVGKGGMQAEVQALPCDAVRVTISLARPWNFETGSHAYLYMPSVGLWTSHPFSIAWCHKEDKIELDDDEKPLPFSTQDIQNRRKAFFSFIVRRRTGYTDALFMKAIKSPNHRFTTTCFAEGPYGSQKLHSFGTVLLFATGVGITHQIPHVRDLVIRHGEGTAAVRRVVLVWVVQSVEHFEWIRPWMDAILELPKRREVLKILLFVTRPRDARRFCSLSRSVQMVPGKPDIISVVDNEIRQSIGAVGVSVCGVGSLADQVRSACRRWMDTVNIEFTEESFTW